MANIFSKFLNLMKFQDEEDDYEEYLDEYKSKESKRKEHTEPAKKAEKQESAPVTSVPVKSQSAAREESKPPRVVPSSNRKVIPVRPASKDLELKVIKPTDYSDCTEVADLLIGGDPVVVNIENIDPDLAQRIMDFIFGTVYTVNGGIMKISEFIYIVSPENVSISGDVLSLFSNGVVDSHNVTGKM